MSIDTTVRGMWCSGEAVNYSAGLGFNGYDERGRSKWNLLDNAEVFYVEVEKSGATPQLDSYYRLKYFVTLVRLI